ncbi:hypothetical protein ACQP2X_21590 [Actinoplanes sp. CA-131856]
MVPDDIVKPPHLGIAIEKLTPKGHPRGLTDRIARLVRACADANPGFDAVEIHECLTKGACKRKTRAEVSLALVLYVLARRKRTKGARRNSSGRD